MADEIRATPQSPVTGAIARKLRSLQELAAQYEIDKRVPLLGGASVDELLSLPGAASLMEDISYDGLRRLIRGGNVATGGIGTYKLDPRVADLADVAGSAGSLAGLGIKAAKPVGKLAAEGIARAVERGSPLTALAQPMHVVKPKGGNWLAGSVEGAVEPLKRSVRIAGQAPAERIPLHEELLRDPSLSPEQIAIVQRQLESTRTDAALTDWIDKKLAKYIKNEMATPEDPVRALAERGVLHVEPENLTYGMRTVHPTGEVFPQLGSSDAAKQWETATDYAVTPGEARTYLQTKSGETGEPTLARNPWLAKVPPETLVYDLSVRGSNASDLGFDHLIDELRNATNPASGLPRELLVKYGDLDKMSVPQAVERVAKINEWRAAQMAKARMEETLKADLFKEYPEQGFRWVQLNRPGQFKAESESMGHSVRGYEPEELGGRSSYGLGGFEAIKRGDAKVYSLRDAKGQPHVTIEVGPGKPWNERRKFFYDNPELETPWRDFHKTMLPQGGASPNIKTFPEWLAANQPEMFAKYAEVFEPSPPRINQIKGKQNRAPNEEYLPFVQDFVRGGNWAEIKDAENAGLRKFTSVFNSAELRKLKEVGAELPTSGWLSGEEIQRLHNLINPEGRRLKYDVRGNIVGDEAENFARGGLVSGGYDPERIQRMADDLLADKYAAGGLVAYDPEHIEQMADELLAA